MALTNTKGHQRWTERPMELLEETLFPSDITED